MTATVIFRQSLIVFFRDRPMRAVKFENLSRPDYLRVTELPDFYLHKFFEMFAACIVKKRYVLVTGGKFNQDTESSSQVFLLDLEAGKWVIDKA